MTNERGSKKRITLIIHSLSGGGAEKQFCQLANHLDSRGFQCTVITLGDGKNDAYQLDNSIRRNSLDLLRDSPTPVHGFVRQFYRVRKLRDAILSTSPDFVVSFCDRTNITTLAAMKRSRIPVVISERSDPRKQRLGWFWESLRRYYYPRANHAVVQTQSVADYFRKTIPRMQSLVVIPTAVDIPSRAVDREEGSDCLKRIIYVGRLSPEKGPDRLLRAWLQIEEKYSNWQLTFIGDGPMKDELSQLARSSKDTNRIRFEGWQKDVWSHLNASEIMVLPSHYEGFPGAVLEAMAVGNAVIATRCSDSIEEIINDDITGIVSDNSEESIRDSLRRLIEDDDLRRSIQTQATQSIQRYRWDEIAVRWDELFAR